MALTLSMAVASGWLIAFLEGASYLIVPGMLTVVAIAVIAVRFERLPFYLLVASPFILSWLNQNTDVPYALLTIPGFLVIIAWTSQAVVHRTTIVFDLSTVFAVFLGVWAILSAINAGTISTEVSITLLYWQSIVFFFLIQNLVREQQHLVVVGWVLALSLGLVGAFVFLFQANAYLQSGGSLSALGIHLSIHESADSNVTGMHIATGIPFAFYLIKLEQLRKRRWRRYLLVILMFFMILGVLSTVSLGATFGLGAMLVLLALWTKNRAQQARLTMLGMLLIGAVLLSPLRERFNDQLLVMANEDPVKWGSYRVLSWQIGLEAVRQAPLFGLGPDRVGGIYELGAKHMPLDRLRQQLESGGQPVIPHNSFLSVGGDLGIPGVIAFLGLLVSVILPLWRENRHGRAGPEDAPALYMGRAVLIALIVLLVQGMGLAGQSDRYLWIVLGLGSASIYIWRRTKSGSPLDVKARLLDGKKI